MILRSFCIGLSTFLSLIFFCTPDLLAQNKDFDPWADRDTPLGKKGTFGRVQFGGSFLNIDDMNFALQNLDYEPLNNTYFAMGIGLSRMSGKVLLNADLYNYMIQESAYNNQLAVLSFHYLTTSIGYLAYRYENSLLIYPSIGLGAGITNLKVRALDEQYHTAYFSPGTLADASLNIRRLNEIQDGKGYSYELGLSLGYLHAIGDQFNFRKLVPDQTVSASPSGFYFRFSFGLGKLK
ncbi:MAG: hypothetical protein KDD63_00325 [Bacteroidetes bacterium]|nr:hypothetical protein [Bacteroidota bacterium]MCB0842402.1 hypothetical protein [Bacteroidota bacterium]MCB0850657.1 hypothetical protein [Bacteroidota bacterium]